jgi:TrmH family RNA methyltransferase
VISNPNNPTIRSIRKLRTRRGRERQRTILVEGHRALGVALGVRHAVKQVLHTRAAGKRRAALLERARAGGANVLEVTETVMASLTSVETAPDVLGVAVLPERTLSEAVKAFGIGVVLAGVRDPATAGSILASCAAAGGAVAIATHGTTDLFASKPVRAAAGAHFVLAIARDVDPDECARELRAAGVRLVSVGAGGDEPSSADLAGPLALVVGEDGAVPAVLADGASARAGLDVPGPVRPSVAVEAGVVLFEAARMRNGRVAAGKHAARSGSGDG